MRSVVCNVAVIWGLLFANDTPLVTSYKEGLEKSFDVLDKWCEEGGGGGKNHNVEVRHNAYEEENGGV